MLYELVSRISEQKQTIKTKQNQTGISIVGTSYAAVNDEGNIFSSKTNFYLQLQMQNCGNLNPCKSNIYFLPLFFLLKLLLLENNLLSDLTFSFIFELRFLISEPLSSNKEIVAYK